MAIPRFLAMTAAEIQKSTVLPRHPGWLACHFSAYGAGLSNLPPALPKGSLLVVDDETPISGHDPAIAGVQLRQALETLECAGVLLDFQRPKTGEAVSMVKALCQALPCPVAVASGYGEDLSCPVFLPPVPCCVPLGEHLAPWKHREVWLELSREGQVITLTPSGTVIQPRTASPPVNGFSEETLHCHYTVATKDTQAVFTLWRTRDDLAALEEEAEALGVRQTVGLWQELGQGTVKNAPYPAHRI